VSRLLPVAGFGVNKAVTPVGRPDALRVTLPVNPFCGTTVMVSVTDAPWATVTEVGDAVRAKLGGGVTVREIAVLALSVPETPEMVTA